MEDLRSVIQDSWEKAVLAKSSVEEQAQQLVGKLKDLGPEGAQKLLAEISGKLHGHRQQLQAQVEDAVRRGLDRIRIPTRADLQTLLDRLEAVEHKLERLEHRGPLGGEEKNKG